MIIAECPHCKASRFSWSEEDAVYKLSKHICTADLLERELQDILNRILEGVNETTL